MKGGHSLFMPNDFVEGIHLSPTEQQGGCPRQLLQQQQQQRKYLGNLRVFGITTTDEIRLVGVILDRGVDVRITRSHNGTSRMSFSPPLAGISEEIDGDIITPHDLREEMVRHLIVDALRTQAMLEIEGYQIDWNFSRPEAVPAD